MSHFGRSGPPDIKDTFSLLVLNITFRTTADDLFPMFDKYGKVVDIFIPRDRRTGDSRGFAFVRYKYADEAQKAVDKLDGRNVDGRDIMVQFAKYGPNAESIKKGRVVETSPKTGDRSRSCSPRPRYRDDYRGKDSRRRNQSPFGRHARERRYDSEREYRRRSRSGSMSPDYHRGRRGKAEYDNERKRERSCSVDSASPARHRSFTPKRRSASPANGKSPLTKRSPTPKRGHDEQSPRFSKRRSSSPANGKSPLTKRSPNPKRGHDEQSPRFCSASLPRGRAASQTPPRSSDNQE